jgi:hypothetical protein
MRPWLPLVLLAACSPRERERVFVPVAAPVEAGTGRMTVQGDGTHHLEHCAAVVVMDAPGRIRMGAFGEAMGVALQSGAKELEVLVDTPAGEGAVPLRLPAETSGLGYYEKGKIRRIWGLSNFEAPGARLRAGFDGAYALIETGPARVLLNGICVERPDRAPPEKIAPSDQPPLEVATFVLLRAEAADLLKDVVLSLLALEKRFPGKVVLEVLMK